MRTVYVDSEYKCHVDDDGTGTAVGTNAFDGKCDAYIEGCRFVPAGEAWTRQDGRVFRGEMRVPWKDDAILTACQEQYEALLARQEAAYQEGVNSV